MNNKIISKLTRNPSIINDGAHILYTYTESDKYVNNAVSFLYEGLNNNTLIVFIEDKEITLRIIDELQSVGITDLQMENLITLQKSDFYLEGNRFDSVGAESKLVKIIEPYIKKKQLIRTWGSVPVPDNESLLKLITYEFNCHDYIFENSIISVCVYNGLMTPAYLQNELLKSHSHLMTDDQFCLSPFYSGKNRKYPSIEDVAKYKRIEKQNKVLKNKNYNLLYENNFVKQLIESIKQSELKIKNIIDGLPIPIIIISKLRAKILYHNNEASEQFNIGINQCVKDKNIRSFCEGYDTNQIETYNEGLKDKQPLIKSENGKIYLVKSIEMLFEEESAILHSFVDITQEKENETIILRSEKMNIAGQLAASIAHEIRNPLTSVKGFFKILKTGEASKELYYKVIDDELSRIEQISNELLTLAKPHVDNRREHNIVKIIGEVVVLLTSESNMRNIELLVQNSCTDVYLFCEETKIKQVFINLIKNAMDAVKENGKVIIKMDHNNDNIQIKVIDNGVGISRELIEKLGEPFYTTKDKGTGLGLMVCYKIIEDHKGTIQVESELGVGSTFSITLPLVKEKMSV
ncbi:MAG: histidine kinase [Bacillales bacterium]|jgi:two-component system sporulation sensor kinase A|nr:histidine kinase [Bacillales bacterium]